MGIRGSVLALVALLVVARSTAQGPQKYYCDSLCSRNKLPCPSPCRQCPKVPPCPAPVCHHPECPYVSNLPPCPEPVCSSVPTIPACPTPLVKLSCPHLTCPHRTCPSCPRCPDVLPCPACNTSLPRTPVTDAPLQTIVSESVDSPSSGTTLHLDGYEVTPGIGIHKMFFQRLNWMEANSTCSRDGAYLVILNNNAEKNLMLEKMNSNDITSLHVGFHSTTTPGNFVTVLGETMTSAQRLLWEDGEPAGGPRYQCVYLSASFTTMLTEKCTDTEYFACEKPMS